MTTCIKELPNRCMRARIYNYFKQRSTVFHFYLHVYKLPPFFCLFDSFTHSNFFNICTFSFLDIFCFTQHSMVYALLHQVVLLSIKFALCCRNTVNQLLLSRVNLAVKFRMFWSNLNSTKLIQKHCTEFLNMALNRHREIISFIRLLIKRLKLPNPSEIRIRNYCYE